MSEYEIVSSDDELIDEEWITQIEKEEQEYNSFYKEENETVELVYIYINKENKIYYVKKDMAVLENKTLDKYFMAKCKGTIRAACKECLSKDRKEYYQVNKKQIIKQTSDYKVARCKVDPVFKLERNLRSRLYHALKNQKADKKYRTKQLTGCELSFLKGYLEANFTEGMTWENHGSWHIDHIKPCCSFDLTQEEEQKKCFHYTNLQPLWANDNLSKGGKY